MDFVYLDHAATTPLAPEVLDAMRPFLEPGGAPGAFGNPSSRHRLGVSAAEALDRARGRVARAAGVRPREVVFTSGGTEANNLAVLGLARAGRRLGRHVLLGPTEHASVREAALALAQEGFEVELARLGPDGALDLEAIERQLRADTVLVAQMLANNEFGSVYPIRELASAVRSRAPRAKLAVDAVQAFGKLDCSPRELGADAVTISAHKVHGPKGAGALLLASEDLVLRPLVFGGGQERRLRPGTENVAALVGFAVAAELAERERERAVVSMRAVRSLLRERLARLPGARILEPGASACAPLPSILSLYLSGVPAEVRLHHLEARGVYVSTGSACQSGKQDASPALLALGLSVQEARQVLRFSFSRDTTLDEARCAAETLEALGRELDAALR